MNISKGNKSIMNGKKNNRTTLYAIFETQLNVLQIWYVFEKRILV